MVSHIPKRWNAFVELSHSIGLPAWIGNGAAVLARWVRQCVVGIKHRRALSRLADLDDHMLADIGLTRGDLHQASCEPIWRDPRACSSGALATGGRHATLVPPSRAVNSRRLTKPEFRTNTKTTTNGPPRSPKS